MQFQGALIKELNVEFAVAIVKPHVTSNSSITEVTIATFSDFYSRTINCAYVPGLEGSSNLLWQNRYCRFYGSSAA